MTAAAFARRPPGAPISLRKSRIDANATAAFRRPKRSEVRKRPSLGTKTSGRAGAVEREEERGRERAEVVEREDLRDEVLEGDRAAEEPEHERDLEADEDADGEDEAVEDGVEPAGRDEGEGEDRRREAAEERDGDLDLDEAPREALLDELREPRARAHRRQVHPDDEGELRDRVPEEVAREGARHELVDEPAGGDDEDGQVDRTRPDRGIRHRVS